MMSRLIAYYRWTTTKIGRSIRAYRDQAPISFLVECAPTDERGSHTTYNLLRERGTEVFRPWPAANFQATTPENQKETECWIHGLGFELVVDK